MSLLRHIRWYHYLLIGIVVGIAVFLADHNRQNSLTDQFLACAPRGTPIDKAIPCLYDLVAVLAKSHSTAELMDAAVASAESNRIGLCHIIGHMVGAQTFKKYGDAEEALAQCTRSCAYSCIHGVIAGQIAKDFGDQYQGEDIAHANSEEIETLGSKYCKQKDSCHVIGHLLYMTLNDLSGALSGCDRVTGGDGFKSVNCQGGVFMQAIGGNQETITYNGEAEPEIVAHEGYLYPCDTISQESQHECFRYIYGNQRLLFNRDGITDVHQRIAILRAQCESGALDKARRSACFESMGLNSIGDRILGGGSEDTAFCGQFATLDDRKSCVLGTTYYLRGFISNSRAIDYCSDQDGELRDFCYDTAFYFIDGNTAVGDDRPVCTIAQDQMLCSQERQRYDSVKKSLPNYTFGLYGNGKLGQLTEEDSD